MTIYCNAHWQVLDDGVESLDPLPPYDFAIERVFEISKRGAEPFYDWPVHMAEKIWVNTKLFNEAFDRAIRFQSQASGQPIDEEMLRSSYAEALRIERDRIDHM